MRKNVIVNILILFSIFVMWNCNVNHPQEVTEEFPDDAVKTAVYSGPMYPSDFYQEDLSNVVLNYIQQWNGYTSTEPATNDYNESIALVNIRVAQLGLDTTKLTEGKSTEKYYEFNWNPDSTVNPPPYIFRIHKSAYFEGVKYGTSDSNNSQIIELGKINYRPLTLQFAKEFFDRLWFFKHYNTGGAVVLKRTIFEDQYSYNYKFYFTKTSFGDFGLQDKISLYCGEFEVDKTNGISKINYTFIKEIKGKSN